MKKLLLIVILLTISFSLFSEEEKILPLSQKMANTAMNLWKDSLPKEIWTYEQGILLKGIEAVWLKSRNADYFKYIQHSIDKYITADGKIKTYELNDYNLDNLLCGRSLLTLYKILNSKKYLTAIKTLRTQIKKQPRVPGGGFWHKKKYTNQMWLDGLYMGEPFYSEYSVTFNEEANFEDIAKQFILIESHVRDPKSGLLYQAWDQSKMERWSDKKTGVSKSFWGRGDGWFIMALVDVLENFPNRHPRKAELLNIFTRLAMAIRNYQDPVSGVWYNVLDKGNIKNNYLESSASSMFVYALAKGVRLGFLQDNFLVVAHKGYKGILKNFIATENGKLVMKKTIAVAALGGFPYRDGSFKYYNSEKIVSNDPKGIGAFLLASVEMERPEISWVEYYNPINK